MQVERPFICMHIEYLEEAFPEPKLYSSDVYQRALERIYFNHWTKKVSTTIIFKDLVLNGVILAQLCLLFILNKQYKFYRHLCVFFIL